MFSSANLRSLWQGVKQGRIAHPVLETPVGSHSSAGVQFPCRKAYRTPRCICDTAVPTLVYGTTPTTPLLPIPCKPCAPFHFPGARGRTHEEGAGGPGRPRDPGADRASHSSSREGRRALLG